MPHTQRTGLLIKLATALLVAAIFVLPANEAQADARIELKGNIGMASATHDQVGTIDDPIFSFGGGGQIAAILGLGGFGVGLDFRYWVESHATQAATGSGGGGNFFYNIPSAGIKVVFDLMTSVNAGVWANFAFGSACVEENSRVLGAETVPEWGIQGLDAGGEVQYNYQLKPYKTYILIGLFAHYQYLVMLADTEGTPNMISNNIGLGLNLGVRFDFSL